MRNRKRIIRKIMFIEGQRKLFGACKSLHMRKVVLGLFTLERKPMKENMIKIY